MPVGGSWSSASEVTGRITDAEGAILLPKFAIITATASGDTAVVAAVAGKKIRVLCASVNADAAVNVRFRSATTSISGLRYIAAAGGGSGWSYSPLGRFETASGEALNINLSGTANASGEVTYIEVP